MQEAGLDIVSWMRVLVALALGTLLGVTFGCSKQARDGKRGDAPPAGLVLNLPPRVIDAGPPADATLEPAPPGTIADLLEDLDGDGKRERIWLSDQGVLTVGAAELQLETISTRPFSINVLDLDPGTPERHLSIAQEFDGDEDPPTKRRLVRYRAGALTKVFDLTHGSFNNDRDLTPEPGGTVVQQGSWEACEGAPGDAVREMMLRHFRFDSAGMLVETGMTSSGEFQDCNQLAACPYVYVGAPGHETLAGEILRNIRGRKLATTQGLLLPVGAQAAAGGAGRAGLLRVRLGEEKPEVTHLDAIVANVDGRVVAPLECTGAASASAARPAFCDADGRAHLMHQGDSLVVTFDLGSATPGEVELLATGYYVPIR